MIHKLPAGHTITATISDGVASIKQVEDGTIGAVFTSSASFGPYFVERSFLVSDNATVTISPVTLSPMALFTSGAGAPESAVQALLTVNPDGDENGLIFTAKKYGADGNIISVEYVDPGAFEQELSVSVFNSAITVSLATGADPGAITSTAAEVKAAIEASIPASKLASVALYTADTGEADDGSGVVTAMDLALLEGGQGTGTGSVLPGALYTDTTNGLTYRNAGTTAVPVWRLQGEFLTDVTAVADAVAITNNTPADVCSLELTPGEWDVSAVAVRALTGVTATRYTAAISLTSATIPAAAGGDGLGTDAVVGQFATFGATVTGAWTTPIPPVRVVVTETTTVYLVVADLFSAGTSAATGTLHARRVF